MIIYSLFIILFLGFEFLPSLSQDHIIPKNIIVGVDIFQLPFVSWRWLHQLQFNFSTSNVDISFKFCIHSKSLLFIDEQFNHRVKGLNVQLDFQPSISYCGLKKANDVLSSFLYLNYSNNFIHYSIPIESLNTSFLTDNKSLVYLINSNVSNFYSCVFKNKRNCFSKYSKKKLFLDSSELILEDVLNLNLVESSTQAYLLGNSFEQSKLCRLWWPLNHSEIFLHNFVSERLQTLYLQQKFILLCNFSSYGLISPNFNVILDDYWGLSSCNQCKSTKNFHLSLLGRDPVIFESSILFSFQKDPIRTKRIVISIYSDEKMLIDQFDINLKVSYGNEHWLKFNHSSSFIHPMASQLESRDDLGFALSSILPNASTFLEVGVQSGDFANLILNTWDNLKIYIGIDSWVPWSDSLYPDIANVNNTVQEENFHYSIDRLSEFESKVAIFRLDSLVASQLIDNESIDVIYLDAIHHYTSVKSDIIHWWPKVKPCGILAGHDYLLDVYGPTIFTVKPAVEEFARNNNLVIFQTYDQQYMPFPSWFLFKPCS